MTDWPVGISTGCFYDTPIFDCLETIRANGFLMLEVCSSPRHLDYRDRDAVGRAAARIRELGMEAYSFHAPFDPAIDITARDQAQRDYARDEILRAAEAAAALEVRHFVIHPGPEEERSPGDDQRIFRLERAAGVLDQVSRRCRELGIGFVLENMLPHLMFGNTSDTLWLMGAIEQLDVGTCLDTGHAHLTGDIYRVMYKLSGHLQMIHANDNRGDGDDHLPPGRGRIDWPQLLAKLADIRFDGGMVLELAGGRPAAEILDGARRARRLLRDISRRLDLSSPPTVAAAGDSCGPLAELK